MSKLVFNVDKIPADGLAGKRVIEPSWFSLPPEADDPVHPIEIRDAIEVSYLLERSARDVHARISIHTVASLTCARCLRSFPFPVDARSRFTFCATPAGIAGDREVELKLEDLESGPYEGDEIDLSGLVYEQIVLSFPIKPLCHADCKGLCPLCGSDRNVSACGCKEKRVDPRWDVLRKLKLCV
jgi:uncharacterized protein